MSPSRARDDLVPVKNIRDTLISIISKNQISFGTCFQQLLFPVIDVVDSDREARLEDTDSNSATIISLILIDRPIIMEFDDSVPVSFGV